MTYEEAIAAGYVPAVPEEAKPPATYEEAVKAGYVPAESDAERGASSEGAPQRYNSSFDLSTPAGQSTGKPATVSLNQLHDTPPEDTRPIYSPALALDEAKGLAAKVPYLYGAVTDYGKRVAANAVDLVKRSPEVALAGPAAVPLVMGRKAVTQGSPVPPEDVQTLRAYANSASYGYLAGRAEGEGGVPKGTYQAAEEAQPAAALAGGLTTYIPGAKATGVTGALTRAGGIAALQTGVRGLTGQTATPEEALSAAGVNLAFEAVMHGAIHPALNLKPVARIAPDALTNELLGVVENEQAAKAQMLTEGIAKKGGPVVEVKGPRPDGPPTAVALVADAKGQPKLREVWGKYDFATNDLKVEARDTERPTPEQVRKAAAATGHVGIDMKSSAPPSFMDEAQRLLRGSEATTHEVPAAAPGTTGAGSARAAARQAAGEVGPTVITPTPETPENTARTLLTGRNGQLRLAYSSTGGRFVDRPPSTATLERGDVVTIHHAGGDIPGVRVVSISKDGTTAKVMRGAVKETWPVSNLTLGGPEAEAAHFSDPGNARIRTMENEQPSLDAIGREVQSWGYVVPERLVARFGISPDDAAALAEDLKDAGWLRNGEQGIYDPARAPAESAIESAFGQVPPAPEKNGPFGHKVYWGRPTADGEQLAGVLRGSDPFNKGSYRVEIKPGVTVALTPEEFNTARPVTIGNPAMARLPAEAGITHPLPPGVTQPQSPTSIAALRAADDLRKKLERRQGIPGPMGSNPLTRAIWNWTHDDVYRGGQVPWAIRSGIRTAGPNAETATQHVMHSLQKVGMNKPADLELNALLPMDPGGKRDAALAAWVQKFPAEAKAVRQTVKDLLAERDANQAAIVNEGLDPTGTIAAKEAARANLTDEQYVRRVYGVHLSARGNFADFAKNQMPDVWNKAARFLEAEARANGFQGDLSAQVNETLSAMMNDDPAEALRKSGLVSPKSAATWKARKQLPPELEDVLGLVHSGTINLAYTTASLREQVRTLRAFKELTQTMHWSRGPRKDLTVQLPNEPRFGLAAGGYVSPDLAWMAKAPAMSGHGIAAAQWLGRFWKQNVTVLGGPGPWVNNVMRNVPNSMALGTLDPANPAEFVAAQREWARLTSEYRKNPSMLGPGALVAEALDYAAVPPGMMAIEGSKFKARTERQVMQSLMQSKAQTPWELVGDVASKKLDSVKDAYDSIDQNFKGASYLILRKRFLAEGMNVHDAAAKASMLINQHYPNFSLASPLARAMSSHFGYGAPFATSKLEDLRVQGGIAARVMQEASQGKMTTAWNLAKAAMFFGALKGTVDSMRAANGITKDDVAAAELTLPWSTRGYKPNLVAGPTLDANGHVWFIDFSAYLDPTMAARGNIDDPLWTRLALGTVNDLLGQGAFQGPINYGAAALGSQTARGQLASMTRGLPVQGDNDASTLLPLLASQFGPQFPFRMYQAAELAGHVPGSPGLGYTNGEMVSKFLGLPLAGVASPETEMARNRQFAGFARDVKKDMVRGALQYQNNPEKQQTLIKKQAEMLQKRAAETFGGGEK